MDAAQSVTLGWDPATDPNVAGYRLYSGTHPGVYTQTLEVGSATTTLVSNLVDGLTYFFVVTAYNTSSLESAPSNEVSYTTPSTSPTPTPSPTPSPSPSATPTPTPGLSPSPSPAQPPVISLSVSPSSVNQGNSATYIVTASPANPNASITVSYAMSGKAVMGTHYSLSGTYGQLTIPAGASSADITFTALPNSQPTRGKMTVKMSLQKGPGYKLSSSKKASITIMPSPSPSPTASPSPTPPPSS